jgi:hypothetical protein
MHWSCQNNFDLIAESDRVIVLAKLMELLRVLIFCNMSTERITEVTAVIKINTLCAVVSACHVALILLTDVAGFYSISTGEH